MPALFLQPIIQRYTKIQQRNQKHIQLVKLVRKNLKTLDPKELRYKTSTFHDVSRWNAWNEINHLMEEIDEMDKELE